MSDTRYRWQLLRAGPLKLDGGSMFGVVPRVVWSKNVPVDDAGRITVAHNCLLLSRERRGSAADYTLIESGSGNKLDEKNRNIFGLTDYTILNAIEEAGVGCDQITHAIVTHLHFDHVGGLTRRGETGPVPTFQNATVYVQQREWDDANVNRSHMTRTYLRENLDPLRDRLKLLKTPPPFPPGHTPLRDELPKAPLEAREEEILPGVFVFLVPGHTWGQQAVRFTDDHGQTVVFTPDILPTVNHVGAAYNMAYDVEPYLSTVNRRWFLTEAAKRDWLLVLDHEPGDPCVRVEADGKGWFRLLPSPRTTGLRPVQCVQNTKEPDLSDG